MGAFLSILAIIAVVRAILGLWLLVKAYQASFGWFLYLILLGLGGTVMFANALGPIVGPAIVLGGALLFVVKYWDEVRTPFLLLVAVSVVQTIVLVQAGRTLADQRKQALTEQVR
jgi:hypothetical protein